jgi:proteasome lid subunit RPN8/RPN11
MSDLRISDDLVAKTLEILQQGGARNCETVVLWPGTKNEVEEVYRPEQIVDVDYFRLPAESVRNLMRHLRHTRRRILAQVHSHPGEAYHSEADDEWAIVRHEGALSLVIPTFAGQTRNETFLIDAAVYRLNATDKWERVDAEKYVLVGS